MPCTKDIASVLSRILKNLFLNHFDYKKVCDQKFSMNTLETKCKCWQQTVDCYPALGFLLKLSMFEL